MSGKINTSPETSMQPQAHHQPERQEFSATQRLTERVVDNATLTYYGLSAAVSQSRANRQAGKAAAAEHKAANRVPSILDKAAARRNKFGAHTAHKRMERAGRRMEKLEHRQALLKDIGQLALTGTRGTTETASGKPATARTFGEKRAIKKIEKRAAKIMRAKADKWRVDLYGRTIGKSKSDKKAARSEIKRKVRNGEMTHRRAKLEKKKINKSPPEKNKYLRKAEKALNKHTKKLERKIYLERKLNKNIKKIKANQQKAQAYRTALELQPEQIEQKWRKRQRKASAATTAHLSRAQQYREAHLRIPR